MQFLSVAEAAERLGVSRVKVREGAARGLIPSKRDNQNRLRLDLSDLTGDVFDRAEGSVDQTALMNLLFDEIEELHDDVLSRSAQVDALCSIANRQADALDSAASQMEQDDADKAHLSDLLARSLAHLEASEGDRGTARLADVSDRALSALEVTGDRLENSLSQNARFDALLERALDYAAIGKAAEAADAKAMGATADRALQMRDGAISDAEKSHQTVARTGDMLDRALQAGERLEGQIAERDREIENKTATVEKVLEMSERAVALAGAHEPAPHKRSFWQWLVGK
jgi:excisionase family DNA binding protein